MSFNTDRLVELIASIRERANTMATKGNAKALRDAADAIGRTCEWKRDNDPDMDGVYDGACGIKWALTEGGVEDNGMNYCPRCGGRIILHTETKS